MLNVLLQNLARDHKKLQDVSDCSKNADLTMKMAKTQVMTNCQPIPIRFAIYR